VKTGLSTTDAAKLAGGHGKFLHLSSLAGGGRRRENKNPGAKAGAFNFSETFRAYQRYLMPARNRCVFTESKRSM
jgi:hypothetical protein